MKTLSVPIMALAAACSALHAQVVPAASAAPTNFSYVLRYSQSAQFSGELGTWQTSTPSGEVDFSNGHPEAPLDLSYAGGYTWTLTGPSHYSTGFFQHFSINQGISGRKWTASVGDDVSYRPHAPVTGFSGIPGTGEPISVPVSSGQSVFTVGTHALNNIVDGELSRILNPAFSMGLGGDYDILRYPDSNGLDTNSLSAHAMLTRRIDGRSSVSGEYVFSQFSYPSTTVTINTQSALVSYERAWSRHFETSAGAGPEWINSSAPGFVPASTLVSANAGLTYQMRTSSAFVRYDRSTGGGSGYMLGQLADTVTGGYSFEFERRLTAEVTCGYRRLSPLNKSGALQSEYGAVQASRMLGRHVSVFLNYTVLSQSSHMSLPGNVVSRPLQTLSFGTTYTPRNPHHF